MTLHRRVRQAFPSELFRPMKVKQGEHDMNWRPFYANTLIRCSFGDKLLQFNSSDYLSFCVRRNLRRIISMCYSQLGGRPPGAAETDSKSSAESELEAVTELP